MCSSCGGKAAALRLPGGSPKTPIVFGELDGRASRSATFLLNHRNAQAGQHKYVGGDGVEAAVEDGVIELGFKIAARRPTAKKEPAYNWFVRLSSTHWKGYTSRAAADRIAASLGEEVLTSYEVIARRNGGN